VFLAPLVEALEVFDDGSGPAFYVGGLFNSIDGVPADFIAKRVGSSARRSSEAAAVNNGSRDQRYRRARNVHPREYSGAIPGEALRQSHVAGYDPRGTIRA
jgi:hypothetical protein